MQNKAAENNKQCSVYIRSLRYADILEKALLSLRYGTESSTENSGFGGFFHKQPFRRKKCSIINDVSFDLQDVGSDKLME